MTDAAAIQANFAGVCRKRDSRAAGGNVATLRLFLGDPTMRRSMILMPLVLCCLATVAQAQTQIVFNHAETPNETMVSGFTFADGEAFEVHVTNTAKESFDISVTGIELSPAPEPTAADNSRVIKKMEHSAKYGGYIVRAALKSGVPAHATLKDRKWYIAVGLAGWTADLTVGAVGSTVVDRKYYLEPAASSGENRTIRRDEAAEDDMTFGFVSFATVYHTRPRTRFGRNGGAWSLGIGITGNELGVYLGPSLRLGDRAVLTVGWSWSRVDDLPAGAILGQPFAGDSLSLSSVTRDGFFFAVSIRGFTDKKAKDFAEATQKK